MKMLEYETANPGADFDELEKQHFNPDIHGSRPPAIVNLQPTGGSSDPHILMQQQQHDEVRTLTGAEAEHYDPDGVKVSPGNPAAGRGRHRRMSAWKGGGKEAGFSPAEASKTETETSTDVYDAAPGVETGNASGRA